MSTDTKIKILIFNKLTQEQYNNADRVPTEFYLTPDTSIDSSEKGVANGVATLDANAKVPAEQIPAATTSTLGGVKPDGTTITVTEDGTISVPASSEVATKAELQEQAAEFQQGLSGKADTNLGNIPSNYDYVVESYSDDSGNWYRKYKSGWVEQGGVATSDNVTLLKPMENANYSVYMSQSYNAVGYSAYSAQPYNRTTTSFSYFQHQGYFNAFWYVCGKGAN